MMNTVQYGGEAHSGRPIRNLRQAVTRGFLGRCPRCGEGKLFRGYAKTVDDCAVCGEHIDHHRADDLPAYLVIFVVGHIVVGAFMGVEAAVELTAWQHLAMWVPATIIGSLALLQPIKGAVVGLQWALHMHGFGDSSEALETHPEL
jgi:uncharacterized protein (DUF983 family)